MIKPLQVIHGLDLILRRKIGLVHEVNDEIRSLADMMIDIIKIEKAPGLAANMVGLSKRIVAINTSTSSQPSIVTLINPEVVNFSSENQSIEESSLCFPGISAIIDRPKTVTVRYLDYNGEPEEFTAENSISTIIQRKIDYLDGKIYLDYLSKLKTDILLKKMHKHLRHPSPHVHSSSCRH
ncbi:MAG: peptide deformylase [Rickettsiaceae bacterium]|nr:MAG: peptide deformylase [Rickettsiaceae bacterium]